MASNTCMGAMLILCGRTLVENISSFTRKRQDKVELTDMIFDKLLKKQGLIIWLTGLIMDQRIRVVPLGVYASSSLAGEAMARIIHALFMTLICQNSISVHWHGQLDQGQIDVFQRLVLSFL